MTPSSKPTTRKSCVQVYLQDHARFAQYSMGNAALLLSPGFQGEGHLDCGVADNDVVARGMKFFVYKRGGHRVIINKMGDLIVRPNPMEASLRLLPCAGSVQQHLLTSYLQSFMAIMVAQFKPTKGPKTDMLVVLDLVRNNSFLQVCTS